MEDRGIRPFPCLSAQAESDAVLLLLGPHTHKKLKWRTYFILMLTGRQSSVEERVRRSQQLPHGGHEAE